MIAHYSDGSCTWCTFSYFLLFIPPLPSQCVSSLTFCGSFPPSGIFDSVTLIVKEPNGQFRPENEWTRQGRCPSAVE
jgi:hypothetical protein